MPKVYQSAAERQQAKQNRIIHGYMAERKIRQRQLAEVWGISQPSVSEKLSSGNITLIELWKANKLLQMDEQDIIELRGGRK